MKILWSPLAVERASEISGYIAQDNPTAAAKWIETVFEKVDRLQLSPQSGRVVPEVNNKEMRELMFGNYRIIYSGETARVSILTIHHGKQLQPTEEFGA